MTRPITTSDLIHNLRERSIKIEDRTSAAYMQLAAERLEGQQATMARRRRKTNDLRKSVQDLLDRLNSIHT